MIKKWFGVVVASALVIQSVIAPTMTMAAEPTKKAETQPVSIGLAPESGLQTLSLNSPIDVDLPVNQSQVYTFTPGTTGTYRFFTGPYGNTALGSDTTLGLYTDAGLTQRLAYNDNAYGSSYSLINNLQLNKGTTYYVKLGAYANSPVHNRLTVNATNTAAPTSPRSLRISASTRDSITLSWNITSGATGYHLALNGVPVGSTSKLSYTFTNLTQDTLYSLEAVSYNSNGTSAPTFMSASTKSDLPAAPLSLETVANAESITLDWAAVENANTYAVYVNGTIVNVTSGTTYTITGLTPNTQYTVGVAGQNSFGTGAIRSAQVTTQSASEQLLLNTPVDLSLPSYDYKTFAFTPAVTGGYHFYTSGYGGDGENNDTVLELYADAGLTQLIDQNDDAVDNFSSIQQQLQAGVTYYVTVRGFSSVPLHARLTVTEAP